MTSFFKEVMGYNYGSVGKEMVLDNMGVNKIKYKIVKTFENWTKIQSMGTYEQDYRNGELWGFNGELWYLSHLELSPEVLQEVVEFLKGAETI